MANYAFDLEQIEAQQQAAIDAINNPNYNTDAWVNITDTNRDMKDIIDDLTGLPKGQEVLKEDGTDILKGGKGSDIFVFNTLSTGIDIIQDFEVGTDKIRINKVEFGATALNDFKFDTTNGALSFNSQQFATLENFTDLQNFNVNRDIQLV